jgi:Predicted membrane protein
MIAICAMILPGISGSLILVLLGQYAIILEAAHQRQWLTLLVFAGGALLGLLLFSKLLKWLLTHYHKAMIYFLSGLMLGTVFKVWPWKTVVGVNIWPWQHVAPHYLMSGLMIFCGAIVVTALFYWGRETKRA